jgi:hypothetical protein
MSSVFLSFLICLNIARDIIIDNIRNTPETHSGESVFSKNNHVIRSIPAP